MIRLVLRKKTSEQKGGHFFRVSPTVGPSCLTRMKQACIRIILTSSSRVIFLFASLLIISINDSISQRKFKKVNQS